MTRRVALPRCDYGHQAGEVRRLTRDTLGTEICVCWRHYEEVARAMHERGLTPPAWEDLALHQEETT